MFCVGYTNCKYNTVFFSRLYIGCDLCQILLLCCWNLLKCSSFNIIIIIHKMMRIVVSSTAQSHMREFTLGPLSESRSAPGGCQFVGQAVNLTFECACWGLTFIHRRQPWGWCSFICRLSEDGRLSRPTLCNPKLRIAVIFVINTETCLQRGYDPGTSCTACKRAATTPLRPVVYLCASL